MANKTTITPEMCRELLHFEPETGKLFWLHRASARPCWNSRYVGTEAFTAVTREGYRVGRIFNHIYKAHRIAWAVHFGFWPKGVIDHINGDGTDNRLTNLRDASLNENSRNASLRADNTSGTAGVYWNRKNGKWIAGARTCGRWTHLGCFMTREDAVAARVAFNQANAFTARHGRV